MVLIWTPWLNHQASDIISAGLKRSLAAFAVARGLNAVISMAQDTDLAVSPAGIGVSFSPGELLDPVNDMIEQFSSVLLLASASMGLQRILLSIGQWWPISVALSLALLIWWWRSFRIQHALNEVTGSNFSAPAIATNQSIIFKRSLIQVVFVLLLIRFAVPITALLNEAVYRLFLQPEYQASQAAIEQAKTTMLEIEIEQSIIKPEAQGLLDRAQQIWDNTRDTLNLKKRIAALERAANSVTENIIDLIVIFVIQTIVFPLLFLWGLMAITRHVLRLNG